MLSTITITHQPADELGYLLTALPGAGRPGAAAARDVGRKRSLALREYTLGMEALHRFVAGEPL